MALCSQIPPYIDYTRDAGEAVWSTARRVVRATAAADGDQDSMNAARVNLLLCVPKIPVTDKNDQNKMYLFEGCEGFAALAACAAGYRHTPAYNAWFACTVDPRKHAKWNAARNPSPPGAVGVVGKSLDQLDVPEGSFVHFGPSLGNGGHVAVAGPTGLRAQASAYGLDRGTAVVDAAGGAFIAPPRLYDSIAENECSTPLRVRMDGLRDVYPASTSLSQSSVTIPWLEDDAGTTQQAVVSVDYPQHPYRYVPAQWIHPDDEQQWMCKRIPYTEEFIGNLTPPLPCRTRCAAADGEIECACAP